MAAANGTSAHQRSPMKDAEIRPHEGDTTTSKFMKAAQSQDVQDHPYYVRALFPFESNEVSSLNFNEGDLIRVFTKLESGWWDGFLRGERGWFPSNYVEEVELVTDEQDEDEVDAEPSSAPDATNDGDDLADRLKQNLVIAGVEDKPPSATQGDSIPLTGYHSPPVAPKKVSNGEDAENDDDEDFETEATMQYDDESEAAYWIPQTTEDGRIYFFNTVSGVSKWDLPLTPLSSITTSRAIHTFQTPITTGLRAPEDEPLTGPFAAKHHSLAGRYQGSEADRNSSTSSSYWRYGNNHDEDDMESHSEEEDGEILLFAMPEADRARAAKKQLKKDERASHDQGSEAKLQTRARLDFGINDVVQHSTPLPELLVQWTTRSNSLLGSLEESVTRKEFTAFEKICLDMKTLAGEMLQTLELTKFSIESSVPADEQLPRTFHETTTPWQTQYRKVLAAASRLDLTAHAAQGEWADQMAAEQMLSAAKELDQLVIDLAKEAAAIAPSVSLFRPAVLPGRIMAGGWQGNGLRSGPGDIPTRPVASLSSDTVAELESYA